MNVHDLIASTEVDIEAERIKMRTAKREVEEILADAKQRGSANLTELESKRTDEHIISERQQPRQAVVDPLALSCRAVPIRKFKR